MLNSLVADGVVQLVVGSVLLAVGAGGAFLWRSWRKRRAIEAGPVPVAVTFEQDPKRIFSGPMDWVTLSVWLPDGAVPPSPPERSIDLYSATADIGAVPAIWQTVRIRVQALAGACVVIESLRVGVEVDPTVTAGEGLILVTPTGGADIPIWNVYVALDSEPGDANSTGVEYPPIRVESETAERDTIQREVSLRDGESHTYTIWADGGQTDKRWWVELDITPAPGAPSRVVRCPPAGTYFEYRTRTGRRILEWDRARGGWRSVKD